MRIRGRLAILTDFRSGISVCGFAELLRLLTGMTNREPTRNTDFLVKLFADRIAWMLTPYR